MISSAQLIIEARRLVGVRFLHQGRSVNGGVDCLGMGLVAAGHAGLNLLEVAGIVGAVDYGLAPSPELLEQITRNCSRLRALRPGALLLFKMPRASHPHHLGLYTEANTFIHAEAVRARAVVEQTLGRPWTRFLHSMWALPGVVYPEGMA